MVFESRAASYGDNVLLGASSVQSSTLQAGWMGADAAVNGIAWVALSGGHVAHTDGRSAADPLPW